MECAKSEFDYFLPLPTQTSIIRATYREYAPIAALTHGAPIEIYVERSDNYLDLNKSYLYVKCKITKPDGTNLAAADRVGPVNLTLHSLFSNIDLELCGKQLSDPNGLYAYRAMFETLLSYGNDVKESQLQAAMWFKDTAGQMGDTRATGGGNAGLAARTAFFTESKEVELVGRPHLDIFHQEKAIPSNCSLKIRLIPNTDAFILKSEPVQDQLKYQMHITEVRFVVRTLEVSHALAIAHEQMLQKMNARFPIRRVTMKHLAIPAGSTAVMHDNVITGLIPERITLAMVPDATMTGTYTTNPFDFEPNRISQISLYVNGELLPQRPYQPDFPNKRYIRDYLSLFEGTGTLFTDKTVPISRDEFGSGYALWVFDLTPDQACSSCLSPPRTGSVRIELKFATANAATINLILYSEFESMIEIDKFRNVIAPNI